MKALILIDSFKGTLTSKELGEITKEELKQRNIESTYFPISDGGDGFLDAISALKDFQKVDVKTYDAFFKEIDAYYLYDEATKTAFIELAKASGINLIDANKLNPLTASTYGLGVIIKNAIINGAKNLVIGIGGSATNDGGSGMLEALGVKFYYKNELLKKMNNERLAHITKIDVTELNELMSGVSVLVMSDVNNPLLGVRGATYIFSPQKGATDETLPLLEENMANYATISFETLGCDYKDEAGSGAAGGVGFALKAYLKGKYQPGIDYLLNKVSKFDLSSYDTVISGEGKIDSQSIDGKVISGIIKHFGDKKIILLCALNEFNSFDYEIHSIVPQLATKQESKDNPNKYFRMLVQKTFNKYNGVIFDLDGTLLDTISDITDAINDAIKIVDCEKVTVDEAKYLVGSGVDNIIKRLITLRSLNESLFNELKDRYMRFYGLCKKNKTKSYEGINELLLKLKEMGVKIAVFSNKPEIDTQEVIDYYFPNIFDYVVGKRDGVAIKPSSEGAKPILDYFNMPKDKILYIGDTQVDMETAKNIGVKSVGALWGFRTKEELVSNGASCLVNCPLEVLGLFME